MANFVFETGGGSMLAITNGYIITMEGKDYPSGTVLIEGDTIQEVGEHISIPSDAEVVDLAGKYLMPGMVDAHCHMGISQDLQSLEAELEFMDDYILPQLRTIDAINPAVSGFQLARQNGITTLAISPGSTYVVGGQVAVVRTLGNTVDEMILKEPVALKMALGEMFFYRGLHRKPTPQARMIVASRLREAFVQGENYAREDKMLDLGMDIIVQAGDGRLPVFVHARRADDIMTALRLAKEFSLHLVLVHATEAEFVADALVKYEAPVIVSPSTFGNTETWDAIDWGALSRLHRSGVQIALCSDHPFTTIDQLRPAAIAAYHAGLPREVALSAITITAADILGVEDEVGSIAEDKYADFVVLDKDPLDIEAKVEQVWLNGKLVEKLV